MAERPSATGTTPRPSPDCSRERLPLAYAYPKREGDSAICSAPASASSANAPSCTATSTPPGARPTCRPSPATSSTRARRGGVTADVADPFVRRRVETHLALLEPLDTTIRRLEADVEDAAKEHYPTELAVLQTTPGVGPILSLTILLEIDAIERFDTRQQFCSYARLCGAVQESAGKRVGVGNRKAGNAWLKWAFSEAAVLSAQKDERIGALLGRLASRLGKPRALSALAHKLGRAFYHMLHTKEVFDVNRFVRR